LLGAGDAFQQVEARAEALARTSLRVLELIKAAKDALDKQEPAERVLVQVAKGFRDAFTEWAAELREHDSSPDLTKYVAYATAVLELFGAIKDRDYVLALALIAESVAEGGVLADVQVPKKIVHVVGFASRIASAEDAGAAKKVFEEEAAPLGTYKVKYDRDRVTLAINSFVGTFVGGGGETKTRPGHRDAGLRLRPLTAPVGLDLAFPSWEDHHLGFMLSVIDPFGVGTLDEDAEAAEIEWGALLMPGLFFRWGIGGSPFAALGGVTYQPLARSDDTCTLADGSSVPCWKGAWQAGVSIAVDIPLIVLH
jgi:hypothetical protein